MQDHEDPFKRLMEFVETQHLSYVTCVAPDDHAYMLVEILVPKEPGLLSRIFKKSSGSLEIVGTTRENPFGLIVSSRPKETLCLIRLRANKAITMATVWIMTVSHRKHMAKAATLAAKINTAIDVKIEVQFIPWWHKFW